MLTKWTYAVIVMMFAVILVMFMAAGFSSDQLADTYTNPRAEERAEAVATRPTDTFGEAGGEAGYASNPRAAVISVPGEAARVLEEWCQLNKYRYRIYGSLPDPEEIAGFDAVLFGDVDIRGAANILNAYAQTGVPLVFTRPPSYDALVADRRLMDFLGIRECVDPAFTVDGIKLFADFFISGERIYRADDDYETSEDFHITVPWYKLRADYKVYAVGILSEQGDLANEELPSLLWRTYSGNSFVFVTNTDLFDGEATLGLVTAFLSQAHARYLYPVVNAQTIAVIDFPLFSTENTEAIKARYSRDTSALTRDILWPNMAKVLENYGGGMNLFLTPALDRSQAGTPSADELRMYIKNINKSSGITALSLDDRSGAPLSQVLSSAQDFFGSAVPDYRFTALYAGPYAGGDVAAASRGYRMLDGLSLVLLPYSKGTPLYRQQNDCLFVLATKQAFSHTFAEDARFVALQTALASSTQLVDMSRVYYPAGEDDDWSRLSQLWSAGITYYADFQAFDRTDIYAMEDRLRDFLAMNVVSRSGDSTMDVKIDGNTGSAWFILRLWHEAVSGVENGSATRLTDTAWLIRADGPSASIRLREIDSLTE